MNKDTYFNKFIDRLNTPPSPEGLLTPRSCGILIDLLDEMIHQLVEDADHLDEIKRQLDLTMLMLKKGERGYE